MHCSREIRCWFSRGALLATLALSIVPAVTAQSTSAPEWSVVTITTIKPEMRSEYEAWQKEVSAAYKKAEVPSRAVLQTVLGDLFEYVAVAPLAHFANMDGPSPLERALGKAEADSLLHRGSSYMTSARRLTSVALNDLSIRTQTSDPAPYAIVTSMRLVGGKSSEFDAWMKNEYLPAMKKAEVKNFWVSRTVFGGDPNERITVRLLKNMAEFDAGPVINKALGEEGARKLIARSSGIVDSVHYSVVHYRADLSYDMTVQRAQTPAASK